MDELGEKLTPSPVLVVRWCMAAHTDSGVLLDSAHEGVATAAGACLESISSLCDSLQVRPPL